MKYPIGMNVEVMIKEYGFEDSYYRAKIISFSSVNGYFLRFKTLLDDDDSTPLTNYAEEEDIRPIPLKVRAKDFEPGDVVDADLRDGWWIGKVVKKSRGGMYDVSFNHGTELVVVEMSCLRIHQEYDADAEVWYYTKK